MSRVERALLFVQNLVLPRRCLYCGRVLGFSGPCAACEAAARRARRPAGRPLPREGRALKWVEAVYAPYFYEPPVRTAILRMKFHRRPELAKPLAAFQAEALREAKAIGTFDALVPVPSGRRERRRRGYDVPLLLARALGRELGLPVVRALRKPRETTQQALLSGEARRRNLRGAFSTHPDVSVAGMRLLIVDDVVTTGTTMDECAKTLREAGAASCQGVVIAAVR